MAVAVAFDNRICRLFRRCTSLLPMLHRSFSQHICISYYTEKDASTLAPARTSRLLLCPKPFNLFLCKHTQKWCTTDFKNCYTNSDHYPTCLHRLDYPHILYKAQLASSSKIGLTYNGIICRAYHGSSKFTMTNQVYSSFLDSLVEEYSLLNEKQNASLKTEMQPQQVLRFKYLRPAVEIVNRIHENQSEIQELTAAIDGENDKEMRKLMEKEIEKYNEIIESLEEELVDALVGKDVADHSDIILEVSAGVGGQEAMLFAAEVLDMYCSYAYYKGWTVTRVSAENSKKGGIRRGIIEVNGQDVYKHMKYEVGVHRVQRVPKKEKAGRIHTSTISVTVLPQPKEIDITIQSKDLKVETFRGSGPGGQSVNTTDSAVRITHLPTGTVSESRQERSQIKNKEIAMKSLKNKLYQAVLEEQETQRRATLKMQMGTRSRSEKIRTYNFQQDRITDHRAKESLSNLPDFMTGSVRLDNLVNVLAEMDKIHILESMLEGYEAEVFKKNYGKS